MASGEKFKKVGSEGASTGSGGSESGFEGRPVNIFDNNNTRNDHNVIGGGEKFEYFGWVYHLGVNSIGHEYCHMRFLFIRGKYVEMYKRDPHDDPSAKPIRRGVVGHTLMVEELGRRKVNVKDFYILKFYNRLDETRKGEIACLTAGDARKWMEAFDHAKQQAEYELSRGGSTRNNLNMEDEINLEGHRPRVRRYAHGLKKLIRIGQGPEMLLRRSSSLGSGGRPDAYFDADSGDVVEAHQWKCVRTMGGVRIFEDVSNSKYCYRMWNGIDRKRVLYWMLILNEDNPPVGAPHANTSFSGKGILVKAVGVVDANADTVFEIVLSLDRNKRYEWDTITGDLEMLDSVNGHYDVVYGTFNPRYLSWWQTKRDFIFSRQWFRGQDGTYTILQFPCEHKKRPSRSGYERTIINPSTWEISNLSTSSSSNTARCLVTQMLEISPRGWLKWRNKRSQKFEKTVPYALLSQVAGLKEYVGANPALTSVSSTTFVQSKISHVSSSSSEFEDAEVADEFYDAISADSSSEDEDDDDNMEVNKDKKIKLKNVAWAIASLALKRTSAPDINKELNSHKPPINLEPSQFYGSMRRAKNEGDKDCWSSPDGTGFMIRGKTYLKDNTKVKGGEPLLKLIAVDWFKVDNPATNVAMHPKSLVQTDSGKKLPFVLVINLEVPAKPNYSLVLYYAADRPVNNNSLLGKFADGTDVFRDSRFKLIPSIAEGYWMVKRAVGTKACKLGKAVTCKYLRQDNFLEVDIDIGSSSVARSVIGLVLGYITSIVVDLAIVIEAQEEEELPEYILGTVRLNRLQLESAVPLEV